MGIKIQTTSNDLILIRKVRNDDAKQYIELINSVWRDAYKNIFPEDVFINREREKENRIIKILLKSSTMIIRDYAMLLNVMV